MKVRIFDWLSYSLASNIPKSAEPVPKALKAPTKKRKSLEEDAPRPVKPAKRRKNSTPPVEENKQAKDEPKKKKGRRVIQDDDESPDELLLTNDTPQSPKKPKVRTV